VDGATVSATLWARHPAALHWCAIAVWGPSASTLCLGRFETDDAAVHMDPPQQARCKACDQVASVQRRVGVGLAELEHAHVIEWEQINEGEAP